MSAPLFPPWSNSVFVAVLVLIGLAIVGLPTLLMAFQRTPYITGQYRSIHQPIPFDHRHHVGDDGIDCRYCHDLVESAPVAGVPPTSRCLNCHSQVWTQSPLLAGVWKSREQGRPIPWVRVHHLPDFVYFDHSAHVSHGVGCVSCHGRVDRMAQIYQVAPLSMDWCVDCHRNPAPQLRPASEITSLSWEPPLGSEPALGQELMQRYHVDAGTSCTTCHR